MNDANKVSVEGLFALAYCRAATARYISQRPRKPSHRRVTPLNARPIS